MERLRRFFGKFNNVGMSLVELVCAIGIMSLVGASVAGFMIVSANTYSRGTTEVQLQEDAQLLASQINNLVQDSGEADTPTPEQLVLQRGGKEYSIYRDSDDTVQYSVDGSDPIPMAENVKVLVMDATDFSQDGVVQIYICLEKNSMTYAGNYTATSRNVSVVTSMTEGELTMTYTPEYVLEPCQEYPISAVMSDGSGIDYAIAGATDDKTVLSFEVSTGKRTIKIGKDETAEKFQIIMSSQARKPSDGLTPRVQETADVYVRRVNNVELVKTSSSEGTTTGTVYTFTSKVTGTNLSDMSPVLDPGFSDDPQGLYKTGVSPRDSQIEVAAFDKNGNKVSNYSQYFEVLNYSSDGTATPTITIRLKKNLEDGEGILVVGKANHGFGVVTEFWGGNVITNMTGTMYAPLTSMYYITKAYYTFDGSKIARGSDDSQGWFSALDVLKTGLIPGRYPGCDDAKPVKRHRFREVTLNSAGEVTGYGMWTQWRPNGQNIGDYDINLRPDTTLSLDAGKAYEVEIEIAMYSAKRGGAKVWPFDDTPKEAYTISGIIKPVSVYYNVSSEGVTSVNNVIGLASLETPYTVHGGKTVDISYIKADAVKPDILNQKQNYIYELDRYDYDKNTDSFSWQPANTSRDVDVKGTGDAGYHFEAKRKGYYRVKVHLNNVKSTRYQPSSQSYVNDGNKFYEYCNEETGRGYFYFYCDGNSADWDRNYFEYDGEIYKTSEYFLYNNVLYKISDFNHHSENNSRAYRKGNDVYAGYEGGSLMHYTVTRSGGKWTVKGDNGYNKTSSNSGDFGLGTAFQRMLEWYFNN